MEQVTLYRPVGLKELELIAESGMKCYPPRLAWQPIFYPVLNAPYAMQIASEWNVNDPGSGYAGFVTQFDIPKDYFDKFEVQNVGGFMHEELWVPAEVLQEFNRRIIGEIVVTHAYYGPSYTGTPTTLQALLANIKM